MALGGLAVLVVASAGRSTGDAGDLVFAVGALAFGFGLTTWATFVMIGDVLESLSESLAVSEDFSAAGSQAAMALLAALGAGVMVGSAAVGATLMRLGL